MTVRCRIYVPVSAHTTSDTILQRFERPCNGAVQYTYSCCSWVPKVGESLCAEAVQIFSQHDVISHCPHKPSHWIFVHLKINISL